MTLYALFEEVQLITKWDRAELPEEVHQLACV